MAFDLKSAKPVSGGFDLGTAKPVAAPRPQQKKKPEETGLLRDIADVGIALGRATTDIAKPFAYLAQRAFPTSILPVVSGTVLSKTEEALKGARSEAEAARQLEQQQTIEREAKAPGALARGISGARAFIEGPKRPEAARTPLSGIADFLSPTRAIASLLPETPEAAQREISSVTTQFESPKDVARFFASQAPATAATVVAGGVSRAGALAEGLGRVAAAKAGQRAAVTAGTTLNATDAGYSAAQSVLEKGGTQQEADRAFAVAAGGAALASAAAAKIPGLEQNLFSTQALKPGIIRGAARSAVGEAPQEFVEEAGAQLAQNIGVLGTAAERDISEGVLSSGALGLIGGAAIGAPAGAVQGYAAKREAAATPPPPPPGAEGEPLRTTTVAFENKEDPANPTIRTFDVMTDPDEDGLLTVRDENGKAFEMTATRLGELESTAEAYTEPTTPPAPTPTVEPKVIMDRLRLASGVPEGQKEPSRVIGLSREITNALSVDDDVKAQAAVNARLNALAASRMSETTRAQRQAELDEAQSVINDYRAERGLARAAPAARVEAPTVESDAIEQARLQNEELARRDTEAEAARTAAERARLERESELETASLIGQASPVRQAQAERQQLFDSIINDDTVENPAGAFRQALRDRGYPNTELNESERRQIQSRRAFTQAPAVAEEEVPAALPPAPPEAVAPEVTGEPTTIEPSYYRETSPERASEFFPTTYTQSHGLSGDRTYLSDTPDLALGQGKNTGVLLEFDRNALKADPVKKPGQSPELQSRGQEYLGDNAPEAYPKALKKVTVSASRMEEAKANSRKYDYAGTGLASGFEEDLNQLEAAGWVKETGPDGSVSYTRPPAAAPVAEEPGVPAFAFGEEPAPSRMMVGWGEDADFFESMADIEERKEARNKLREELSKLGFDNITVVVRDLLDGGKAGGTYDPMDSIIRIAMRDKPEMMTSVMYHELIHYLKDHGFFTDKEWASVLKMAKRDLMLRGVIEYVYRGETRATKDEEVVAEAFRAWMDQKSEAFKPSNHILARIRRFLNAIRDFFYAQGLRDSDAVFEAISNGQFATREDKGSAKKAEYLAGLAKEPSVSPMYAGLSIIEPRAGENEIDAENRRLIAEDYAVAQEMEQEGRDAATIRVATGWERNPYDNEWRYIQADDMARETALLEDFVRDYDSASDAYLMTLNSDGSFDLQDLMRHSELYSIYPEARDIKVFLRKSGGGELQGSFDPSDKSIDLYADARDPLDTLLHEVQHWVQDKEGFAFGSSPATVWEALTDEQKRVEAQAGVDVLNGDLDDLSQVLDVMSYLSGDPDFRAAVEDGTAMQDLEGFFGKAFDDGLIVDDRIYGLVQERLEEIEK